MKIHNFGSDYAYQQKLKKEAETERESQLNVQPITKPTDNVADQLQAGGEAPVETTNEIFTQKEDSSNEKKKGRKKKKERADNGQQMPTEC